MNMFTPTNTLAKAALLSTLTIAVFAPVTVLAQPAEAPGQTATDMPAVTHAGSLWIKGKYEVNGAYRIETRGDRSFLVLADDFETRDGPDLKVALSPLPGERVTKRNALDNAVVLGILTRSRGPSEFEIPAGTDLSRFRSLVIHCEEYTVLWGAVDLNEGELVATASDWTKKNGKTRGRVEIAKTESGIVVRLGDRFDTKSAPDLKIVLSPHTPRSASNDNALRGGTIISPLRDDEGAQSFTYAGELDLSVYRSVLIHCEQYTKLWAVAPLERTGS